MNEEEIYARVIFQLTTAVHEAFHPDRSPFPALILLYSSLDIISSLNRPTHQLDTGKKVFMDWVDDYMLCGSTQKCCSADVYAARCGIVHTLSLDSLLSRVGKARRISYVTDDTKVGLLQTRIDPTEQREIVVDFVTFGQSFINGAVAFTKDVDGGGEVRKRVFHHVRNLAGVLHLKTS